MANAKTYTIIPDADLTQAKVDACLETDLTTVRKNRDGSKAVLKWLTAGGTPGALGSVTEYTHDQILTEVAKSEWTGRGTGDAVTTPDGVDKQTITDAESYFLVTDVGKNIVIEDATNAANDGTFPITDFISATQIKYTNAAGVAETSTFTWRIE